MAKNLVIVESPAKARTLARFLGPDFRVEASIGHVRDLPESAAAIPTKYKKEPWARLGVNVENGFAPLYVIPGSKKEQIKKLRGFLKEARFLFLATDEDREGESISWHLKEVLRPRIPFKRLVFHEITKEAVSEALRNTRDIDQDLVKAQEARRIVDRLYGYAVSPLLWKKVKPRLSAGRVQSVAVRLVVQREKARMAFRPASYWDLEGAFAKQGEESHFRARLVRLGGRRLAQGRDFDPRTGRLKKGLKETPLVLAEEGAKELQGRLAGSPARVISLEEKPFRERPNPPFTTSTLQQEANRELRLSARRTMDLAQRLYENGFITYMRTDSITLSREALDAAKVEVLSRFGADHYPGAPRQYRNKVKNVQEAHEAIRPAGPRFTDPEAVKKALGNDARRLYEMIWCRTVASQMRDGRGLRVNLEIGIEDARFQAGGRVLQFPGFHAAYGRFEDQEANGGRLPGLAVEETLEVRGLEACAHQTQAPPRLTEAGLVKELEARGIGRPSTYASIIETILKREYVRKQGNSLIPTFTAFAVVRLLEEHLAYLVDYGFTARMEDELDSISLGNLGSQDYLSEFYLGNARPGLKVTLEEVEGAIDPRKVCGFPIGKKEGRTVEVRVGRYGPFLSWGDLRASVPEDLCPDELSLAHAIELLEKAAAGPRVLGKDPETGLPVFSKAGRYGPYVQLGDPVEGSKEKPRMASLLSGMDPETLTLQEALGLLGLPRLLGKHPGSGEEVFAANGRYGPYVYCGKETRSLGEGQSPLRVRLEEALNLLSRPKERRRSRARREPLKELGEHPVTGEPIRILDGRFGPYVTDGTLNVSIPRGTTVEEVTPDLALEMLAEKAAREKGTRKRTRKKRTKAGSASGRKAGKKAVSRKGSTRK